MVTCIEPIEPFHTKLVTHERNAPIKRAPDSHMLRPLRGERFLVRVDLQDNGPPPGLAHNQRAANDLRTNELLCHGGIDSLWGHLGLRSLGAFNSRM